MDEPQLTSEISAVDTEADKSEINEILQSGFEEDKSVHGIMEVEDAENQAGTSSICIEPMAELTENVESAHVLSPDVLAEDTGLEKDVSMTELTNSNLDIPVEPIEFEASVGELDVTAPSEIVDLDFTEASVNISQLNVENNDDSNDAFNALKQSETDALQEPKEEQEEELKDDKIVEEEKPIEPVSESEVVAEASTSSETQMEVDDFPTDPQDPETEVDTADIETESSIQVDTEISNLENKDETGEVEEIPEDDETTETTNEGEGVDENLCLLGDETECDAEKDSAIQIDDVVEDEAADEQATTDKETTDEVLDIDEGSLDKEVDEPEIAEVEEIRDEPEEETPLKENEIREIIGETSEQSCLNCENVAICLYKLLEDSGDLKYLCTFNCVKEHREDNPDKYSLTQSKVRVYEIREPIDNLCVKCNETKPCKYRFRKTEFKTITRDQPALAEGEDVEKLPEPTTEAVQSVEEKFICDDPCLKEIVGGNEEKYVIHQITRRSGRVRTLPKRIQPEEEVPKIAARSDAEVEAAKLDRDQSFVRRCNQCFNVIDLSSKSIQWEAFDFCDEKCLGQYQNLIGSSCAKCNQVVSTASIGKLCVRFGSGIKQFCATECLNDFKKSYVSCALCSKNLKNDDEETSTPKRRNQFCDEVCAKTYEAIVNPRKKKSAHICSVCNNKKLPKVEVILDGNIHHFCSNPCFSAFKFVNNVSPDQCDMCTKYFERKSNDSHTIYQGDETKMFCTQVCMAIFITKAREIWQCNWCKVSKYSLDMIQSNYGNSRMCSLNCSSLYEVSINALSRKRSKCDHCKLQKQPQYHLTMSDSSIRNFCTYQCVIGFQSLFSKSRIALDQPSVVPAGTAKRIKPASATNLALAKKPGPMRRGRIPFKAIAGKRPRSPIPVPEITVQLERLSDLPARVKVSSLSSLTGGPSSWKISSNTVSRETSPVRVEHKTQVVTIPPLPKQVGNKSTMCKSITLNKAINCVPATADAECQTDDWLEQRIIIPVPIPIFVPQPMMMYSMPTPVAVPFALPIPVPVFVPTTRNSASGIMKEIKKIQEKMPTDPYEAELLMMAEMVAGDKKREETDSDSDENNDIEYPEGIDNNASFNEDLVQMAFKMAGNDFDDPPVDLENEMTANTISQTSNAFGDDMDPHSLQHHQLLLLQQQRDAAAAMQSNRGRKRIQQPPPKQAINRNSAPNKRIKREMEVMQPEIPREPAEKPDANMCLKYTFGVNAWKQWVATKNADFEKSSIRRKPIKSEILQLTADELNYSLCMFVKEVRKPNGSEYAPDTIYYLVLGIQQYLYENGRIDNIFTDRYYEQFTDCLDEVAKKFSVLYNDSQYIVTRVEEEHLWECKQLGAHSPHVLLSTLMFFNTKHFNLVTVDEHMELSFSHIMKHWKRNPNQPGAAKVPGSRNVLLRFYPPQSSLEANSRKKKVYEQQENEENPLRCPVKLYEFYLSKCPESVKTRNDVFYLQPERSCVPDSPVWYSTQPLSRDSLSKMLHRVKMVKEINIALLTS